MRPVSPLQALLLVQLEEGPKYGYEMFKAIKDEFEGIWEPKTGSIYPVLKSLERRGFVATEIREETEFYHITEKGRALFKTVGEHMQNSMKFTTRYFSAICKWMTPEMKTHIIDVLGRLNYHEMDMNASLFYLLDESTDKETKLRALDTLKKNVETRLAFLDRLQAEVKGGD